jgi:hypothetical protein
MKTDRTYRARKPSIPLLGSFAPKAILAVSAVLSVQAQYPASVVDYRSGTGFSAGYTNATSAIGMPSRITSGEYGGPVDPLSPPYTKDQLVSIGTGGSLTLRWDSPIKDAPGNPYGLDFTVFGSTGFLVTNEFDANWKPIGNPATDGSLFNPNLGTQRISVSSDGKTWYVVDAARSAKVDHYYPTDGSGDFGIPMSTSLQPAEFSGKTLDQIRELYRGSAGGTSFDLAWALDAQGNPAGLTEATYLRIEVLSGKADIDGLSTVSTVPEPHTWALMASAMAGLWVWRRSLQPLH